MPGDPTKKNRRKGYKSTLTKLINNAKRSMALNKTEEVERSINSLEKTFEDFEKAHEAYHADLTEEKEVEDSTDYFEDVSCKYADSLLFIRQWLDDKSSVGKDRKLDLPSKSEEKDISRSELLCLMNLPKLELQTFDGNPLQYHSFMAIFDEHVEKATCDPNIKLSRLLQCTTGKAKEAIRACSLIKGEKGYEEAKDILKRRFGDENLIVNQMIGNLRTGKPIKTTEDLQHLADELQTSHATLTSMNKLNEVDTQSSIVEIASRLQQYLKTRWKKQAMERKRDKKAYPDFTEFVQFVVREAEEATDPIYGSFLSRQQQQFSKSLHHDSRQRQPTTSSTSSSFVSNARPQRSSPPCIICKEDHRLFACEGFKKMKPVERLELVRVHKLCENCLLANHVTEACRKPSVCSVPNCGKKHTKFIHVDPEPLTCKENVKNNHANLSSAPVSSSVNVALPVVEICVNDNHNTCALLDTGSTNSFCTKRLVDVLGIQGQDVEYSLSTLNADDNAKRTKLVNLKLTDVGGKQNLQLRNVYVVDTIPVNVVHNVRDYDHFQGLPLNKSCSEVDILIGQDHAEALIPLETRRGKRGDPFAVRTLMGWSVNGPVGRSVNKGVIANFVNASLDESIKALWDIESDNVNCKSAKWSNDDKHVIQVWDKHVKLVQGHYELPIPWRDNVVFTDNLPQAMSRLISTIKSVEKKGLRQRYDIEMDKVLSKGYAEVVSPDALSEKVWYLPHHPVINPKKPEKLRIVFDCAAKHAGQSLNDRCFQGPDLNNKLIDVMLRFRQHQYAVISDVESMYHQVKIPIYDRDALRFLWYDTSGNLIHCRMTSHLFGGVWCACSATYALRRLLHDYPATDDAVQDVILNAFYVDDCLFSAPTRSEVIQRIQGTISLLSKGGFRLTKFVTNDVEVLSHIPVMDRATEARDLCSGTSSKVLGVKWDVSSDEFYFDVDIQREAKITKRRILSITSSIFDPLGFVNPVVISGRLLFQEAVRLKLDWDDEVPPDLLKRWEQWVETVKSLGKFRIPRCVKPQNFDDAMISLHHFCDASLFAYGFCTYVRCINKCGEVAVQLLMSKCRVAPIKPLTIPKLELQAAVLASRADQLLRHVLTIHTVDSQFWTDSDIVLKYICNDSLRFCVFVGNRISEIRQLTQPSQWHHVPGKDNPADLVTRGVDIEMDMKGWLNGPEFLHMYGSQWPVEEIRGTVNNSEVVVSCVTEIREHPVDTLSKYYSSWFRLKRAVVWWLRLKEHLRTKNQMKKATVSLEEIKSAEVVILNHVQQLTYKDEVSRLKKGEAMSKSSSIYDLAPFIDTNGLLRVGGRVRYAAISENRQHPIIIPHKHAISSLIVRDVHCSAHVGIEWTLGLLRSKFWVTRARQTIKSIIRKCVRCRMLNASAQQQQMSDLPPERLEPGKPPFTYVGMDVFGPFATKLGRSEVKRWGCIFTCFTTRAIHLEMLYSMDTNDFLNAFRRFSARRGTPCKVWSDNGTNFVGGHTELNKAKQELHVNVLQSRTLQDGVEWVFHPPHASHMGGVWERLIRTVRKVLTSLLQDEPQRLTDQVLITLFCEVENIVNNRPITKVSGEATDLDPLTPNHLLLLRQGPCPPPGIFTEKDMYRRRWRYIQFLSDQFWKRWIREYLPELQRRQKWRDVKGNIAVNDLIMLCEENTPRHLWPLGKVVGVIRSKDGLVRSVKVKTRSSFLVRPVTKVVLLEGDECKI